MVISIVMLVYQRVSNPLQIPQFSTKKSRAVQVPEDMEIRHQFRPPNAFGRSRVPLRSFPAATNTDLPAMCVGATVIPETLLKCGGKVLGGWNPYPKKRQQHAEVVRILVIYIYIYIVTYPESAYADTVYNVPLSFFLSFSLSIYINMYTRAI